MTESRVTVFISHVHKDEVLASHLKSFLENVFLNADVFVSARDLGGGQLWIEELRKKLEASTAIIALVTRFSSENKWVHFEAGAGFTRGRTIPVVADGITFATLSAPFKLLQARTYDDKGLRALAADIAGLAGLREPSKFPGVEEALLGAQNFIGLRAGATPSGESTTPKISVSTPTVSFSPAVDENLRKRSDELADRARTLITRDILRRKPTFDIPSPLEMTSMDLGTLFSLARAVGVSVPMRTALTLPFPTMSLPAVDAATWEKQNSKNELDDIDAELSAYEHRLGELDAG